MPDRICNFTIHRLYCDECRSRIYIGYTYYLYGSHRVCETCFEDNPSQVYETEQPKKKVDIED